MAKKKEIGALWLRQGKNQQFLSGKLEFDGKKLEIVVFPNGFKDDDRKPDYLIYESQTQISPRTTFAPEPEVSFESGAV